MISTKNIISKEILLSEGDISNSIYFVDSGLLRLWNNNDGVDITLQFFFPGDVVSSFESFYFQKPSKFSLDAVENSTIYFISHNDFTTLLDRYPDLYENLFLAISRRFIDYTNYFFSRIKNNPEQRFIELSEQNPLIFKQVPHYYIASYLGITPVSLSRIRNRLNK
ncbi:Crp/Fnr family transcriptional regulator [Weissella diestrammenae]|uniref:Crp/Fnr family transcriptional regulator n=2 Tax=Weissella diestrammenae TaxID=1162633 RepID=A0A7G9T7R4_9LACO|nr:Crp/Fnr family transcriptional regulator [Weissella diestrammenae]